MNSKKTLIAVLMAALLVFAFAGVASAAVNDEEIATKRLMAIDVVQGDPDGNLRLDDGITRAEFAAIVVRLRGMENAANSSKGATQFPDVKTDAWYTGYINLASGNGIIKGDPTGTFRPNDQVNYAEAAAMLVRVLGYDPAVQAVGANWPNNYLSKAGEKGILDGVNMADWKKAARRGDVFHMTDNALDVDLMVQKSYGTEVKYEEDKDKSLLNEYLDVKVYDKDWADDHNDKVLPKVTKVPMVDVAGLKDNEITIKDAGGKLKVAEWINPDDFMGQSVEVWVHDKETVLYLEQDKDETVKVDKVDGKFKNKKVSLDKDGDDYEFVDEALIYVNGVEYDKKLADFFKEDYDGAYIKVVLNDDDDVTFADIRQYNEDVLIDETFIVDEVDVDDEYIDTFALTGSEDSIKLKDADYRIVKDGKTAGLNDLEKGDVLVQFELDKDEYYLEVLTDSVSGDIEDYYAKNNTELKDNSIVIDGERHYFAAKAVLVDSEYEDVEQLYVDDVEDLVGVDVVAFFNPLGDVVALVTDDDLAVTSKNFGVIVSDATPEYRGGDYTLTILNNEGKKLNFTFDPEDVDLKYYDPDKKRTVKVDLDQKHGNGKYINLFENVIEKGKENKLVAPVAIKYNLNSKGDLKQIELLSAVGDLAKNPDYYANGDSYTGNDNLDKYDDVLYAGRSYYDLDKRFVAFNLTKGVKTSNLGNGSYNEIDDPKTTNWDSIKDKELKFGYFVNKDKVEAIFVYDKAPGVNIASDTLFAMVDGYTTVNGEKGTILLTPDGKTAEYENDVAKRRAFIAYELDGDEIEDHWVLAYKDDVDGSKDLDLDQTFIETAKHGVVERDSGNMITVDGKSYRLQDDVVKYNLPDGEIVRKAGKGDFVLLIDTDDDGTAIDYVIIIKEEESEDVVENEKADGTVTWVDEANFEIEIEDNDGNVTVYELTGSARTLVNKVKVGDEVNLTLKDGRLIDIEVVKEEEPTDPEDPKDPEEPAELTATGEYRALFGSGSMRIELSDLTRVEDVEKIVIDGTDVTNFKVVTGDLIQVSDLEAKPEAVKLIMADGEEVEVTIK